MNIKHEPHGYQPVLNTLRISTLGIRKPNDSVNYTISGRINVTI